MSAIIVKSNFFSDVDYQRFIDSANALNNRGFDESGYLFTKSFALGHKLLKTSDVYNIKQPVSILDKHLVSDSLIINKEELKNKLIKKGYGIRDFDEATILFKLLKAENVNAFNQINGAFALAFIDKDKLIAARDPFGIRSLYYSFIDNDIIVASSIKAILEYTKQAIVNTDGLKELLGMGPSNSLGKTLYKNVYELKPGHFLTFDKNGLVIKKYYELESKDLNLTYEETKLKVKKYLKEAIGSLSSDISNPCSLLSGGLDSSIVSLYLNELKSNLNTYSMDYEQDVKEYKPNQFETSNDQDFIPYVLQKGNFIHQNCKVDVKTLVSTLKQVVDLNDAPGMADIDGALLWLCNQISPKHKVIFSGEGSDEIFAGYPWFYREDGTNTGFPWLRNLEFRQSLLNDKVKKKVNLVEYVQNTFDEIKNETPLSEIDTETKVRQKQLSYVTMSYFMKTLLKRSEVMSKGANCEIRMPFSDKRLVELMYNTPFTYKYEMGKEKALLRDACKSILPKKIYQRTKSPFPKVRSKEYELEVSKLLKECLEKEDSCLHQIFDAAKIYELIETDEELSLPWFGQLMRKPQLIAYLYQIDYWFRNYNIKLEI